MSESFFVYQNKEYPFDISLFQQQSKCNLKAFFESTTNKRQYFYLTSDFDNCPDLSESSIQAFISYIQNQKIAFTNSDILSINFLSLKYNVESLSIETQKYISMHAHEIIDYYLSIINNEGKYHLAFEDLLSSHISEFFNDDRLLNIPIHIIHRILIKYLNQKNFQEQNEDDDLPIIEFLLKYIEKQGPQASFLLTFCKFGEQSCEYLNDKLSENFEIVDFEFIKPTIFRSFHFMNKKQKEKEAEIRKEYLNQQKKNIESIRSNCITLFNELLNIDLLKQAVLSDEENDEKKISSSLVQYGLLFSIRSIFNNSFVPAEQIQKDISNISMNESNAQQPSKFDILNLLMKDNLFSKSSSILLGNKDYNEVISLVAIIKEKQTKMSVVDLFKLIESKPSLIKFVSKVFPNYFLKETEFEIVTFWINLTSVLIENNICFSLTIDKNKFVFNKSSSFECKIELIMNDKNSFKLSQGSKIHYANNNGFFSLNVNDDILVYYMLLEFAKRQMKTAKPMNNDDILNFYFLEARKRKEQNKKANASNNFILSIKNLFESTNTSIISMIWNLVFTLSELEIFEISTIINPIESQILIAVQKMFKFLDQQNIYDIFAWSKWIESFDQHEKILTKCVLKLNSSYDNIILEAINSLINLITNGINFLGKAPEVTNKFCPLTEIISKCQSEKQCLMDLKNKNEETQKQINELIKQFSGFDINDVKHNKMKSEIIEVVKSIKIFHKEKYLNALQIIEYFCEDFQSNNENEKSESISWPPIEANSLSNQKKSQNYTVILFDTLIFYSKIKSLLKEMRKTNNEISILIALNEFPEMANLVKILLNKIEQNSTCKSSNDDIKNAFYSLEASLIMKLYNINKEFITDPKYLCNFINSYAKRNQCSENDIKWIDKKIKEMSQDFLISVPKFEPKSLVFLIIDICSNGFVAGPLLSEIKNLEMSFIKNQSSLICNEFESFQDAAKAIGQVFYNTLISKDEIPPQDYNDLKNIFNEQLNISGIKQEIIEKLKILFSIADSLENWSNSGLLYDDIFFLSIEWKQLWENEKLLNDYPSLLYWICQNKEFMKNIRSIYHNFTPNKKKIPLWLIYLRIITSKQCIKLDSTANTNVSKIINEEATSKIIKYFDESNQQKKQINYDWLNLVKLNIPRKMKNINIKIIHDFINLLSFDDLDNQSTEIKEKKYQYVKESISELTNLILSNKSQDLIHNNFSNIDSIEHFLCYPSIYIQNKIDQNFKDHKKEALFKYNYNLIDISKINQNQEISFSFEDQFKYKILEEPIFYLSSTNEICCTINKLVCQIGPLFPSLLVDEPITINLASFIDEKLNIAIECPEYSQYLSTKEKIISKMPIQIIVKPPNVEGKKKQIINMKGNLKINTKGINEKCFPFDITLILLPMKATIGCLQFPLSKIKKRYFRLCCNQINSEEKIDIEINNYYLSDSFILNSKLEPLKQNEADEPILQINANDKKLSITMPHVNKPTRGQFNIIIKLSKNLITRIRCDLVIRPINFVFEMYDFCSKSFFANSCQVVLIDSKLLQYLHFRIISPYPFKQKAKIIYKFQKFINVEGSSLNNDISDQNENVISLDDLEVNGEFYFNIIISNLDVSFVEHNEKYYITLEISGIRKTIQLSFYDPFHSFYPNNENKIIMNNEYLSYFPCYSYSNAHEKWEKISSCIEIQNLKKSDIPYVIATPFASYSNVEINYHPENPNCNLASSPAKFHITYIKMTTLDKNIIKTSSSSNVEKRVNANANTYAYAYLSILTSMFGSSDIIYYPIIGFIDEDNDKWFPAFDEYPKKLDYQKLQYSNDKEKSAKAELIIKEIENSYQSKNANPDPTSSIILVQLLKDKNVILQLKTIINIFPKSLQIKLEGILNEVKPYIDSGESLSNEMKNIISCNLIITFLSIFKAKYYEIKSHQFCLQLTLPESIIQNQIDKLLNNFMKFNLEEEHEINANIKEFLKDEKEKVDKISIWQLPESSKQYKFMLINENNHSKPSNPDQKVKLIKYDACFNEKTIAEITADTILSLPSIDFALNDSLSSYMELFSSCSQGAIVLPAFILMHMNKDNDYSQSEKYLAHLFSIFKEVTRESQVNKSILSCHINRFIELFRICVNRLKMAGIKFGENEMLNSLNETNYQYNELISMPEKDLLTLPQIEWNNNKEKS